jgi:hypothetical protein
MPQLPQNQEKGPGNLGPYPFLKIHGYPVLHLHPDPVETKS